MSVLARAEPAPLRWWYAVAFVEGAAVLALELAGARLLTPLFGQSLGLWSVLITVTLAALAAGYGLGARLARRATRRRLGALLMCAGVASICVGAFAPKVFMALSRSPGYGNITLSALVAVGPALVALGATGPVLVDLTEPGRDAGVRAGHVFAISTVGSLIAGPLTGLLFLPAAGTRFVFACTGGVLVVLAGVLLAASGRRMATVAVTLIALLGAAMALQQQRDPRLPASHVLARYRAAEGQVVVLEFAPPGTGVRRRLMLVDGHVQNAVDPGTGALPPDAYQTAVIDLLQLGPGDRAAILGLGSGVLASAWAARGVDVIAAEPNPAVIRAAREHFAFAPDAARVRPVDGRVLVRQVDVPVDAIVVDAFVGATVPAHLFTVEALREARARLAADGVWVAWVLDVAGVGDGVVWPRVATSSARVFTHVDVWRHTRSGVMSGYLVVAYDGVVPPGRATAFVRVGAATIAARTRAAPVQTDDRADLDIFGARLNAIAHRELRARLGADVARVLID